MDQISVAFQVNGEPVSCQGVPELNLLRFLRDQLRLTGTKDGCDEGHCGTCMVLIDDKPTRACLVKMRTLEGKRVRTIEGISWNGDLHPFQRALVDNGGIQCGFCTPGMVISGVDLLDHNPNPSVVEIKKALRLNLCRCGCYVEIIQSVQQAAQVLRRQTGHACRSSYSGELVGISVPDKEGEEKVQGRLTFADDMYLEGMLYGKALGVSYPHAEVISIDTSQAQIMPGVACVLTAKDIPGSKCFGAMVPNQPVLCDTKVRSSGDALALVFAESLEQAEAAATAIQVKWRKLEVVDSPQKALGAGAARLHEQGNICRHVLRNVGDVEKGFREADVIVEEDFTTPFVEHAYLEPESGLAVPSSDGRVTVYCPTQSPFDNRRQIAASLGVPEEKVRVIPTPAGGAFGGKVDITIQIWVALGAAITRRPCKITLTRRESLRMSTKRHAYTMHYKVGARKDGSITAVDACLLSDAGPYAGVSPLVMDQALIFSCGPYVIPNARIEGWAVYTNNADGGAFRGFGINQPAFAMESCMDMLAEKLGMDALELRLKNALEVGKTTIGGELLRASAPMKEVLRSVKAALEKMSPVQSEKKVGIGLAAGFKNVGAGRGIVDSAGSTIELTKEGDVLLRLSTVDMGQGNRTTMAQLAAETIGVSYDRIKVISGDTDLVHKAMRAVGERQTFCGGNAVLVSARQFQEALLAYVANHYGVSASDLSLKNNKVMNGEQCLIPLEELGRFTAAEGEVIRADYNYIAPRTYPFLEQDPRDLSAGLQRTDMKHGDQYAPPEDYRNYPSYAYTAQLAVVEVDEVTGKVKVLKIIAAHDVGRALNPSKIQGQLEGSCLMGLGYALSEQYRVEKGIHLTRNLGQCRIPTIRDLPEIECIIIEDPDPNGPLGAKGISEVATVPSTPAIINAIYNAVGVRITSLPATKEKVLAALKKRASRSETEPVAETVFSA